MRQFIVRRAAEADILDAQHWYETRDPDLGTAFAEEIQATMTRISEYPQSHSIAHRDVRRALVHRFPYSLFYRDSGTRIVVLGCFHHRRSPSKWLSRR